MSRRALLDRWAGRVTMSTEATPRVLRFSRLGAGAFIGFASPEVLWKVITPKRWEILRAMTGTGPLAIREVARPRDVKSVHGDVQALLTAGVIDHVEDGRIVFPFDEIHVDFVLRAA